MRITKKHLHIDPNQGQQEDDRAFGFIGMDATFDDDYQGWFFVWPGTHPGLSTVAERDAMLDSLDEDETESHSPQIPHRWARQALAKYIRERYDFRFSDPRV